MGSLNRKIRRKRQQRNKKHNKKNLKRAVSALSGLPTTCTGCSVSFDPSTDADTWVVHASPGNERISLFCPVCAVNTSAN